MPLQQIVIAHSTRGKSGLSWEVGEWRGANMSEERKKRKKRNYISMLLFRTLSVIGREYISLG